MSEGVRILFGMQNRADAMKSRTLDVLNEALRRRFPRAVVREGHDVPALATGVGALDALLPGGGLPLGRITLLCGPPSTGRTGLALAAAARVTREDGERAAWLDAAGTFHPPSAAAAGVDLERLVVVRPQAEGLLAATVLLGQRAARLVVLDLTGGAVARANEAAFVRLGRAAGSGAACLVLADAAPPGAPLTGAASLVVNLDRRRSEWQRSGALARLGGLSVRAEIVRSRFGGEGRQAEVHLGRPTGGG